MGSGGFFVQSERFIEEHGGTIGDIMVFGQESNPTTWRLAAMNMVIRGIDFDFGKEPEVFEHLGHVADGGAYPAVRSEIVGAWKIVIPDNSEILDAFHRTCAPFFERAEANRLQSRTLTTLRDTLLPKLISNRINV